MFTAPPATAAATADPLLAFCTTTSRPALRNAPVSRAQSNPARSSFGAEATVICVNVWPVAASGNTAAELARNADRFITLFQTILNAERAAHRFPEQLGKLDAAMRHALHLRELDERFERHAVRFDTIGERIGPKELARAFEVVHAPRNRKARRGRLHGARVAARL